ncbi:hypothetical protein BDR03DRAFT_1019153 [Suillus americanus]|nr:hypothetical protein BDR03DRAFT_1019153 [Suillus americanus]
MPVVDILIPGPVKHPMLCLPQAKLALRNSVGQEDQGSVYVVRLLHDKEDQVHPHKYGIPASSRSYYLYHPKDEVDDTIRGSLQNSLQSGTSHGTAVTTPQTQMRGHSKTITAVKPPAPAPAPLPSSRSAVPAAAPSLAVPAAALALITLLEACVAEQDGKIDTLQCLHEGLRHEIIDRHPSFPLPDTPANAASLLLDQSGPHTMSPPESTLPPLIDLSMEILAPTTATATFPDASAIEGLLFDYDQVVHPED